MESRKALVFLLSGRFVQAVLAIASMKLATHYLSSKEMGNYYVLSSIATLFGITLISPIGQFINRRFHSWFDAGVVLKRFAAYNYYVVLISLLSIPITFISKKYFGFITEVTYFEVFFLSGASIYLNTWLGTIVPALNMLEKRIAFTIFTSANLAGGLFLSVVLVYVYGAKGTYWYLGQYVLFQFIIVLLALIYLIKLSKEKFNKSFFALHFSSLQINSVLKFSAPLMIATFFMWLLNDSYRFIIEKVLGLEALGQIAVGLSISASIFALLESLFQQIYYPKFYRKITNNAGAERQKACQDLINISFPGFIFTTFYLSCSAPFILKILTSGNYSNTYSFIIFGFGISLMRVLTNVISSAAHSELNTKKLIMPYAIGGISSFVILFVLLSLYKNYNVAGIILLLVNILVFFAMRRAMSALADTYIPWRSIFSVCFLSLPFLFEIIIWEKNNDLISSMLILGLFGIYYFFILYKKFSNMLFQS